MRALVYRRGGFGDTLLTFPLLEVLKKKNYNVTAVGNTDYYRIALECGFADRVLSEIPEEEYDLRVVISFDGNVKPFPKEPLWLPLYYLKCLGFFDNFSQELPIDAYPDSPLNGKAVIHPSSGSPKKNPPSEFFFELKDFLERELGLEVIFLLGEAEENLRSLFKPHFFCLSPLEMAKSLKGARLFVGLDSGVSHLASYLGVESYVVFGPTDERVWRPIGKRVKVIKLPLECSPCFPNTCSERTCLTSPELSKRLKKALSDNIYPNLHSSL